ncbi:hypothetical protein QQ999_14550 [Pseudomonas fluorescens]
MQPPSGAWRVFRELAAKMNCSSSIEVLVFGGRLKSFIVLSPVRNPRQVGVWANRLEVSSDQILNGRLLKVELNDLVESACDFPAAFSVELLQSLKDRGGTTPTYPNKINVTTGVTVNDIHEAPVWVLMLVLCKRRLRCVYMDIQSVVRFVGM